MFESFESEFERNLYALRREKLKQMAAAGQPAYPNTFVPPADHPLRTIPAIRAEHDAWTGEQFEINCVPVAVAGRLMAIRQQGKAGFATLQQEGQRLQIYVRKDAVGDASFDLYKQLDLGDHIGVTGYLFRTRTNELTVHVKTITFLAKALLALPEKYHGLSDIELRYRQRYVDLFMNGVLNEAPEGATDAQKAEEIHVRDVFVKRAAVLRAMRKFFDARGYIEVETPMMQPVAGGAMARPFVTYHNTLDMKLFLRIAPELYLKRLVVGGFDRVYEINRNFRNEGISTQHNPEFTMLEFYQAYANYKDLIELTQELIAFVAKEVNGTTITHFNGVEIDLGKWETLTMREAIIKWWPEGAAPTPEIFDLCTIASLKDLLVRLHLYYLRVRREYQDRKTCLLQSMAERYGVPTLSEEATSSVVDDDDPDLKQMFGYDRLSSHFQVAAREIESMLGQVDGRTFAALFEHFAEFPNITLAAGKPFGESRLIQPTIIYEFPLAVSPLSKQKPDEPDWVERFEFYIGGFELGNAFSELNDPEEQFRRFKDQLEQHERGDEEAHQMDLDYVRALAYGLPPTGGEGIGIDRLTMILTGARSIRDVILFPLLRPVAPAQEDGEAAPRP